MSVHEGDTRAAREQRAAAEASQNSLRLINATSPKLSYPDTMAKVPKTSQLRFLALLGNVAES